MMQYRPQISVYIHRQNTFTHVRVVAQQYMSSCSLALSEGNGGGTGANAMLLSGAALNKALASLPPEVCVWGEVLGGDNWVMHG